MEPLQSCISGLSEKSSVNHREEQLVGFPFAGQYLSWADLQKHEDVFSLSPSSVSGSHRTALSPFPNINIVHVFCREFAAQIQATSQKPSEGWSF